MTDERFRPFRDMSKKTFAGRHDSRLAAANCLCALLAALTFLSACSQFAHAQDYPAKAVRIIVPFAAGGPNDLAVRPVAPRLSEYLGQPFVVDYRAGANGIIGSELVARSAPDGYTLLVISSSFAIQLTPFPYRNGTAT